eukprot:2369077-Pyramimonas_sp.AAC.1
MALLAEHGGNVPKAHAMAERVGRRQLVEKMAHAGINIVIRLLENQEERPRSLEVSSRRDPASRRGRKDWAKRLAMDELLGNSK